MFAPRCSKAVTNSEAQVHSIIVDTVLPVVVSYADRAYGKSSSSTARREGGVELEDLLRYGGARCVSSLAENRAWLHSMYLKLASVGDYDEVLMNLACRLLSCHGLLRMGAVALQAKLSIHPRNRASDLQPGLVTVSFSSLRNYSCVVHSRFGVNLVTQYRR